MSKPTISDIAKALNITPSTVSRALAGNPRVSDQTRALVIKKAEELGYEIEVDESVQVEEKPAKKREKKAEKLAEEQEAE